MRRLGHEGTLADWECEQSEETTISVSLRHLLLSNLRVGLKLATLHETELALRRFLFFAHEGKVQRRQADQQTNQILCLNLVTNAIVTWNTVYMNAAIERLRAEGKIGRDIDLGHLSPALYGHVNPYGKYRFEIEGRAPSLRPLRRVPLSTA